MSVTVQQTARSAPARDWTAQVCRAVHAGIDSAVEKPYLNPGPKVFAFAHDGHPTITYRASRAPAGSALISEPGWYSFNWGPRLAVLADYLWRYLAEDLALIGVTVQVPDTDTIARLYWGPMPGEHMTVAWPRAAVRARDARDEYLEQLLAAAPACAPLPYGSPARRPRQEDLDRMRALNAAEAATDPPRPLPEPWQPGRFGKGFISASGRIYTWATSAPGDGSHPQHRFAQRLIAAQEGEAVMKAGRELTGDEQLAHACPIVIAPDGGYTQQSAEPLWQDNPHTPELTRVARRLRTQFPPEAFAQSDSRLRHIPDRAEWDAHALGTDARYGHAGNLLDILNRADDRSRNHN